MEERLSSRYRDLSHAELATLLPELLLCGHLIDRAGMPFALGEFGAEGMTQIAIEEWAAASPIYTKRMQRALRFEGDDVITIFKGLQLDIGAPPQFMDFRYTIHSPMDGEFSLNFCGALMDVEPMGEDMVTFMCHDIEDPTFDATAVATNATAQMRPIHRPPRTPSDRHPHCAWTVKIDDSHPEAVPIPQLELNQRTRVATLELDPIDARDDGLSDYAGPLVDDIDFDVFSHSALVRLADEVVVQMHLLNLSFNTAVRSRAPDVETYRGVVTRQLIGHAGLSAERLHRALKLPVSLEGAARVLELHPVLNPAAYVDLRRDGLSLTVTTSAAHEDGAWLSRCGPHSPAPLQAIVRAVDPHFDVEISGTQTDWTLEVVRREAPAPEADEVAVTKFSQGATFQFQTRKSLPLTVL
jgi:hypothetical protein